MSSEKVRRWTLREHDLPDHPDDESPDLASIGFEVDGPGLRWEDGEKQVEVAEVSALRVEFEEELLSSKAKAQASAAIWTEIDGPLGRATTDSEWEQLSGHQKDEQRFAVAVSAALAAIKEERDRG
jgi:hypothetical protein